MAKWKRYEGDYEKEWYDIRLFNGVEYQLCYPNAGTFYTGDGDAFTEDDIEYYKPSNKHPLDDED